MIRVAKLKIKNVAPAPVRGELADENPGRGTKKGEADENLLQDRRDKTSREHTGRRRNTLNG